MKKHQMKPSVFPEVKTPLILLTVSSNSEENASKEGFRPPSSINQITSNITLIFIQACPNERPSPLFIHFSKKLLELLETSFIKSHYNALFIIK